jgi:5-methylcytosine-specific restriction endonuclease McrBC GTP-binding regulatory subunit McrB
MRFLPKGRFPKDVSPKYVSSKAMNFVSRRKERTELKGKDIKITYNFLFSACRLENVIDLFSFVQGSLVEKLLQLRKRRTAKVVGDTTFGKNRGTGLTKAYTVGLILHASIKEMNLKLSGTFCDNFLHELKEFTDCLS